MRSVLSMLALLAVVPDRPATRGSPHLDDLRLLPPVLVAGEAGFTLDERMRHYNVQAVSVAVFKDDAILWTEARGLADREGSLAATTDTLFQAGSISKPVAAAAVLREAEAGRIRLDRDVNEYLKSWKLPEGPLTAERKATFELILSHGAGLTVHGFPGYAPGRPLPTIPQVLDGAPPANTGAVRVDMAPGTRFRYSGGGYTVAQLALSDTLGRPFPDLAREIVLSPAGMPHSTYEQPLPPEKLSRAAAGYRSDGTPVDGKRHTYPEMAAAGLWTTSADLCRFAIAVDRSLRGEPGSFLSKAMAERMTTRFTGDVGLGFFLESRGGETYFGHGGADEGFQALLAANRGKGYGAAVMVNSDNGIALAGEIVRGIARAHGWAGYLPEPVTLVSLSAPDLGSLDGRYQLNGDEALIVSLRDGRLIGRPPLGDEYELLPLSRDLFVRKDRPTRYQVERSDSSVTSIVLLAGDERTPAARMASNVRLPSELLAEGRTGEALAAYRKLFAETPGDGGVAEGRLNRFGYRLAGQKRFVEALAVLRLNTELYPESTNTYVSLGEIHELSGDRAGALGSYRKLLEVLSRDGKTDPALKERLRANAEARIETLSR